MFRIVIDATELMSRVKQMPERVEPILRKGASALAAQTHAHILEEIRKKLHSTREQYEAALDYKQIDEDTWLVSLDKSAFWIEDGIEPGKEMIDDLLKARPGKGPVKTAKDGSRYRVIPFKHNKAPTRTWAPALDLQNTIRAELKSRKIPYGVESHANGTPKIGLLHSFERGQGGGMDSNPKKTHYGPGQGWGLPGTVRQGPTGIPFLQGVRIYQHLVKDKEGNVQKKKDGSPQVRRDIMTFRIVSTKHKGTGRWTHPGMEGKKFLDEAFEWAIRKWNEDVYPDLQRELLGE